MWQTSATSTPKKGMTCGALGLLNQEGLSFLMNEQYEMSCSEGIGADGKNLVDQNRWMMRRGIVCAAMRIFK